MKLKTSKITTKATKIRMECNICLEKINPSQLMTTCTSEKFCGHHFHKRCLMKWKKHSSNCPVCRKTIVEFLREKLLKQRCKFTSIYPRFSDDKEIVLHVFNCNSSPNLYADISEVLQNDDEIIQSVLNNYTTYYKDKFQWLDHIPQRWKENKEFAKAIVQCRPGNLSYLSPKLKNDVSFIVEDLLYCSKEDFHNFGFYPNSSYENSYLTCLLDDNVITKQKKFWLQAVEKNPYCIFPFSEKFTCLFTSRENASILKKILYTCPYAIKIFSDYCPFVQDRKIIKDLLEIDPMCLEFVDPKFRQDIQLIKLCIQKEPRSYEFALGEARTNEEIMNYCLERDGFTLRNVPLHLIKKEKVLLASKSYGLILMFLKNTKELKQFTKDEDIVRECFINNQDCICAAAYSLRNNKKFIISLLQDKRFEENLLKRDFSSFLSVSLKEDEELMKMFLDYFPESFINCSFILKNNLTFVEYALNKDIKNIKYVSDDILEKIKTILF